MNPFVIIPVGFLVIGSILFFLGMRGQWHTGKHGK